jgi:large subunit ribosomal protein L19
MLKTIDFVPGDIIRVHQKIREGDKTRTQIFEGTVLQVRGRGENKSFTVRKMVGEVGVERIWHVGNPNIDKIDLKEKPRKRPRRAKLSYLRTAKK